MKPKNLACPVIELENDRGLYLNCVMSNCDHTVDQAIAEQLKAAPDRFARYAGWDFNGRVWWAGADGWACEVWVYSVPQEIFTADTLEEIMRLVSDKYGYE